jgi:hypothetical protein
MTNPEVIAFLRKYNITKYLDKYESGNMSRRKIKALKRAVITIKKQCRACCKSICIAKNRDLCTIHWQQRYIEELEEKYDEEHQSYGKDKYIDSAIAVKENGIPNEFIRLMNRHIANVDSGEESKEEKSDSEPEELDEKHNNYPEGDACGTGAKDSIASRTRRTHVPEPVDFLARCADEEEEKKDCSDIIDLTSQNEGEKDLSPYTPESPNEDEAPKRTRKRRRIIEED